MSVQRCMGILRRISLSSQQQSSSSSQDYLLGTVREFSRRSVNADGPYKVIKGRSKLKKDNTSLAWRDPNFDLLASKCFPFFMHGNIGPAWYDADTTVRNDAVFIMEEIGENPYGAVVCKMQGCPHVLRKTVCDLFPHRNLDQCELSVVTISIKHDLKSFRKNSDVETEKLAQTFVLAAKGVCNKLRRVGYWADFINPFSGRPYFSVTMGDDLYNVDEKFRCMDFQIFEIEKCLIVSNEDDKTNRSFIGSLFTNAPSKKNKMTDVFTK